VFTLSFFHSILLERRRFGPVGWNIPYEFTISDFRVSLSAVRQFFLQTEEPWEMINYMVGEAYYGGRVTDPMDRRLLITLLERFMNSKAIKAGHEIQDKFLVPESKSLAVYIDEVSKYKINQSTEVFGLHPNAEITSQILKTSQICATILSILPQES
jgi:dynein heavy chain